MPCYVIIFLYKKQLPFIPHMNSAAVHSNKEFYFYYTVYVLTIFLSVKKYKKNTVNTFQSMF